MVTSHFHPIVQTWFERRFVAPTEAQAQGWPAIAAGHHTLIAAPTGSGKTLAAFLTSLDRLVRQALDGALANATQVVYVSPLKALANDIQRNLIDPLDEINGIADEMGTPLPAIRVGVRTGDTSVKERALHAKQPPHVLITTPESLFILLTSERGRNALKSTRTLIMDELHAVAPNKRGSHLSLSIERLCHLAEQPVTRIGLSATQKPIKLMASFLTGSSLDEHSLLLGDTDNNCNGSGDTAVERQSLMRWSRGPAVIVDVGHKRNMDISVKIPENFELGPIATHEQWSQTLDEIAKLIEQHRTTLLFVNTRRLVERVAHLLSERLGEQNVAAHHGSLSKETRFDAEQRLKAGSIKVCVATASLELGIDVGDVDLVCQVGSPRNIGVALQRVGRSGHWIGGIPKGRFYPLTRDELVEMVALLRAIDGGRLDALHVPPWPLDVLAQQVVAACVTDEWDEDDLFTTVRQAYPYHDLPRERFDDVIKMLSEGIANRWGRSSAYLHRDGIHHTVKARRGARLAAITSGGAIPDTADYRVVAEPEATMVGTVNEDFAIESMAGDVFLLGNVPWKIRRVESGIVRVESAVGMAPTIPFWLGEAPGRTVELSDDVSLLRREVDERLPVPETAIAWVMEAGVDRSVAEQVVEYIAEGKRVLGMVPTVERIIAERFFDETGGMQLVIHSPWGARINRTWGLALRKRFCVGFNFELQAAATDEGINISLGPQHSFPVEEVFKYVKTPTVKQTVLQALLQGPIFPVRWRWVASRSLALLRQVGGKRVPTPIQRMRSDDLLAAVFPDAAACQDNMPAGVNIVPPDHPLVFETVRDCLHEALDLEGLTSLLTRIEKGEIAVYGKDTVQPSAFSHQILNAMPYAFLDDAPLEERRARAVTLRRALPDDSQDLGALDPDTILIEEAKAWPGVRDADELHDALLSMVVLDEAEVARHTAEPTIWNAWFHSLAEGDRVFTLDVGGKLFWVAAERVGIARAIYPDAALVPACPWPASELEPEEAVAELLRGHAEVSGPFTVGEMAERLALTPSLVTKGLIRLETQGTVLRGRFRPGAVEKEFCDRRILSRIHRATIGSLRREIEPVSVGSFTCFMLEWQHATPSSRITGEAGMIEIIEQLQGFEAAAVAWESALLPYRLTDYQPSTLDALCLGGEFVWGRFARRTWVDHISVGLSRNGPVSIALRENVEWLLDPPNEELELKGAPAAVLEHLQQHGASFIADIASSTKRLLSEVEDALWVLVAAGVVTADGFGALRGLVSGLTKKVQRRSRFTRRAHIRASLGHAGSRWSVLARPGLLPAPDPVPLGEGDAQLPSHQRLGGASFSPESNQSRDAQLDVDLRAAQLLRRYGIITRELMAREPMAPPWRVLVGAYRRAEARGEIRGGHFVAGLVGEQFALPEAIDALRAVNRRGPTGEVVKISACDPLNLVGIITPGPRVPAVLGNELLYRDGVPVGSEELATALLA